MPQARCSNTGEVHTYKRTLQRPINFVLHVYGGSGAGNYEASCIIFVEAIIMQVIHNLYALWCFANRYGG